MILSQIAACSSNRVIGRDNRLPWHLPEDLKYFKEMTAGKIIIMGRKTFESLPKMLPKRFHIVISRQQKAPYENPLLKFVSSLDEAVQFAESLVGTSTGRTSPQASGATTSPNSEFLWSDEVFVVGGGEIYKAALPISHRVYLTEIEMKVDGDAFFPELGAAFKLIDKKSSQEGDVKYHFCKYEQDLKK